MDRVILLEGANYFRDMGGYPAAGGLRVRRGLLYRSDHLAGLTVRDLEALSALRIQTIFDFRGDREIARSPDRLDVPHVYRLNPQSETAEQAAAAMGGTLSDENQYLVEMAGKLPPEELAPERSPTLEMYRTLIRERAAQAAYARMLELLLRPETPPCVMHCRGGKDRTGVGAAIVLYLLGVSMEDIIDDYLVTGVLRESRNAFKMDQYRALTKNEAILAYLYSLIDTRRAYIEASFEEMARISGTADAYLENCLGMTAARTAALRGLYLEPADGCAGAFERRN